MTEYGYLIFVLTYSVVGIVSAILCCEKDLLSNPERKLRNDPIEVRGFFVGIAIALLWPMCMPFITISHMARKKKKDNEVKGQIVKEYMLDNGKVLHIVQYNGDKDITEKELHRIELLRDKKYMNKEEQWQLFDLRAVREHIGNEPQIRFYGATKC